MKDKGFLVAFGRTNGAPVFYSLGISRRIRCVTILTGAVAAIFSVGLFLGRISKFKFRL